MFEEGRSLNRDEAGPRCLMGANQNNLYLACKVCSLQTVRNNFTICSINLDHRIFLGPLSPPGTAATVQPGPIRRHTYQKPRLSIDRRQSPAHGPWASLMKAK